LPSENALFNSNLPNILHSGKVRDTYILDEELLLMVVTDRISAFDVVMQDAIPGKGEILAQMSKFWFEKTEHIIPNHFVGLVSDPKTLDIISRYPIFDLMNEDLKSRSMIIKKAKRVDMECIVRGYITGSAWNEYLKEGTINKVKILGELSEAQRFSEFIFTPSTKAEVGHDEPLSPKEATNLLGDDLYHQVKSKSIEIYSFAHEFCKMRGMIIADTKFEFGFIDGKLSLIDEVLTPDSSRFWDSNGYVPGTSPPPYDKQYLRNWLSEQDWNKEPPAPHLPTDVIDMTFEKYNDCLDRITGIKLKINE
jgi:phosphoribosylaminoimidazole-succinocarboxamide synthase|tara:strand:+ start:2473 stop:3396 length:924 start_codon:yes stop_codon:yes gene_type:complete